ncbi:MAG: hypothetical protein ACYDAW_13385 [Acidithiobacillus ferrivorans]
MPTGTAAPFFPWPIRIGDIPVEEKGIAHNALDDAIWQAKAVQACMQKLRDRAHP